MPPTASHDHSKFGEQNQLGFLVTVNTPSRELTRSREVGTGPPDPPLSYHQVPSLPCPSGPDDDNRFEYTHRGDNGQPKTVKNRATLCGSLCFSTFFILGGKSPSPRWLAGRAAASFCPLDREKPKNVSQSASKSRPYPDRNDRIEVRGGAVW